MPPIEPLDDKSKNKKVPGMDDPQVVIFNMVLEIGRHLGRCADSLEDIFLMQATRAKKDEVITEEEFDELFKEEGEEGTDVPK